MNRSILIVICDFLLVSLVAFSSVDLGAPTADRSDRPIKLELNANRPENRQDLAAVMQQALDDERRLRTNLEGELAGTRATVGQQQATLTERDRQIQEVLLNLQTREQQAQQLAREKAAIEERARELNEDKTALEAQARLLAAQRGDLEKQLTGVRGNLANLQGQLAQVSNQATLSREQAAATQEQLRKEQERAAALQQQLGQLETSNRVVQAERQQLSTRLQVVETEKKAATEQAARMQQEVQVVRAEKERLTQHADKLADNVKVLASKSGELAQEIREARPLSPNAIFQEVSTNRVHARFHAFRRGLLGIDVNNKAETEMVLVSDGTNIYALCHVEDTAVTLANPAPDWESLTGTVNRGPNLLFLRSMSFSTLDPRLVFFPLTAQEVKELGCKVYPISPAPFKFQDAVVVGARQGYYGECRFEIDLGTPQYLKMDRSFVRGLFGKFNPSRGDLVFSKTGELLGLMANNTYCLRLLHFTPAATVRFGQYVRDQRTGGILSSLQLVVERSPFKLQ